MFSLLILVIFGLAVGFFAAQNTGMVNITVGNFFAGGLPLYIIIIGSMLLGIFVSWLISMVNSISSAFKIHGKESELKNAYRTIDSLKEENNILQLDNVRLKGDQKISIAEKEETKEKINTQPAFIQRLQHTYTST